jgi:GMP synthase-like glutamine amidotransferase
MRVLVVRHHEEDDAGFIADAFRADGASVTDVLLADGVRLPDPSEFGHLVVLGAVSSVNDEHAWIAAELEWLRRAEAAGVPVLGICFGAQALCVATGGTVQRAPRQQIGWMTVETADPGLVPAGPWLEFHSDRCLTPAAARVLARDDLCTQAYSIGRHLGVRRGTAQAMAGHGWRRRRGGRGYRRGRVRRADGARGAGCQDASGAAGAHRP